MTVLGQWHDESSRWLFRLAGAALLLAVALYALKDHENDQRESAATNNGAEVRREVGMMICNAGLMECCG